MKLNKDESKMNVQINMNMCFICGKGFEGDKERHHAIPRCMKPAFNVLIPIHRHCHKELNKLYVSQQKSPVYDKVERVVSNAMVQLANIQEEVGKLNKGL